MKRPTQAFVFLFSVLSYCSVAAEVVNFENLTLGETRFDPVPNVVESGSFTFSDIPGSYFIVSDSVAASGKALAWCPGCTIEITATNGDLFSLDSIWLNSVASGSVPITITGHAFDGRILSREVDAVQNNGGVFTLGGGWTGLERVELTGTSSSSHFGNVMDDVRATVVPLPATIWLFLSGLSAIGLLRKRKP